VRHPLFPLTESTSWALQPPLIDAVFLILALTLRAAPLFASATKLVAIASLNDLVWSSTRYGHLELLALFLYPPPQPPDLPLTLRIREESHGGLKLFIPAPLLSDFGRLHPSQRQNSFSFTSSAPHPPSHRKLSNTNRLRLTAPCIEEFVAA